MRETPILGLVVIEIGCIILFCLYLNIYTSNVNYLLVKYIDSRKYISYKIRIRNNTVIRVSLDLGAKKIVSIFKYYITCFTELTNL